MARAPKRGRSSPLDEYRLEDRWWRVADARNGRAGIIGATHRATGLPVMIKQWRRKAGVDDMVLAEIWRDEIRQLHRLTSFPGARDRLAMLVDSIVEPEDYTLILATDQRRPLAVLLDMGGGQFWFRNTRAGRNRLRLWQEIKRIAEGLDILHCQGLLHRNLDAWSILTTAGTEPDFLLTGFEWSMRLSSMAVAKGKPPQRADDRSMSFYDDWRALGVVAAQLLGFPSLAKAKEPYRPDVSEAAEFLYAIERDLLTLLLTADPNKRIDAATIVPLVDEAIQLLQAQLIGTQAKLVLALQIGRGSRLSDAIREASERRIDVNAETAQKRFVADSLQENPRLVRLKPKAPGAPPRYQLVGRRIAYELQPFLAPATGEESWSVARSTHAWLEPPSYAAIDEETPLDRWDIEIVTLGEAAKRFSTLQGKTTRWDALLTPLDPDPVAASRAEQTFLALALVQTVEALLHAASIWPVRIVSIVPSGASVQIALVPREDHVLKVLSEKLGLGAPSVRFAATLSGDNLPTEGEWKLSDEPGLSIRDSEPATWRFVDIEGQGAQAKMLFEGTGPAPAVRDLFLRFGGAGHDSLTRRRLKALKSLRNHVELLAMLGDPSGQLRPSHDPWPESATAAGLDESKAHALRELWELLPLYLVQGPPGVGKTRLVQELAARRLESGATERLLLTAQSHAAVDHLLDKVCEEMIARDSIDNDAILALRCRPRDRDSGSSPWDMSVQARAIATRLEASELVAGAPEALRKNVRALVASLNQDRDEEDGFIARGVGDRSFEALLLRSANLVFASTNAQQLERLVEEQARFDWAIVEEAGKATGVELIAPMLLSHRRLMIGDHKQLPPFNASQLVTLLQSPGRIRDAIEAARPLIARQFGQLNLEELLETLAGSELETLAPRAREMLLLFETMLTQVLPEDGAVNGVGMARRLEHQHRMHPAIAGLVSRAFYSGKVRTDEEAERRFREEEPPLFSADPERLPDAPIVFVDMPFARAEVGMPSPETRPRWTNRSEARACMDVLELLRARGDERPSLALLSPYRAQVRAIDTLLSQRMKNGALDHLAGFKPASEGYCATVDSFQGNEADTVVISLVRNNHRVGARALGFLDDPKRMNVLISRARWRLVLVGSWDFLAARFAEGEVVGDDHGLAFLRRLLDTITELTGKRGEDGRPLAAIVEHAQLAGAKP